MATVKYSRQREAIKTYLLSTTSHPTAETVYEEIQKIYPNISLGTVYRNLNFLVEHGEALKLSCGDDKDHFDGTTSPHSHFYCRCCNRVLDLDAPVEDLDQVARYLSFQGKIESSMTFFHGVCPDCMKPQTFS